MAEAGRRNEQRTSAVAPLLRPTPAGLAGATLVQPKG